MGFNSGFKGLNNVYLPYICHIYDKLGKCVTFRPHMSTNTTYCLPISRPLNFHLFTQ